MVFYPILTRYEVLGVGRVPWVGQERRALSRAMASFPPAVRTVMAQALRPLDTLHLVDIHDGSVPLSQAACYLLLYQRLLMK